jgi:hypothetical protein
MGSVIVAGLRWFYGSIEDGGEGVLRRSVRCVDLGLWLESI